MEEYDEEHGCSHQFAAVAAYVGQFDVFYLHIFPQWNRMISLEFRVRDLLHQFLEQPCQTEGGEDIQQESCPVISAP